MESNIFLKEIRRLAKRIKKDNWEQPDLRVAVLGSASIQYFVMALRYLLFKENVKADIYEGEYNGIAMDVFDEQSRLYSFRPEVVILLPYWHDIKDWPVLLEPIDDTDKLIESTKRYYQEIWQALGKIDGCKILQANFVVPPVHCLGNLERQRSFSKTYFLAKLNEALVEAAPSAVNIIDWELLAQMQGKYKWFDMSAYFLTKQAQSLDVLEEAVAAFVRSILALRGKVRKCLVLDLDNTLWGGVVGDDGWDGIELDPNNAVGEAYRAFQAYVLNLKQRGVILAVCSKNDESVAKEPFEKNEHMLLKLDDIACFVANWDDKATNLKRIAQSLNIGVDSLVFVDDNPAEREIIRQYLPEVHVVDVPEDPALYVVQLDREMPFDWQELTKEDILRSNSYIANRQRQELQHQFVNYEEYLQSLQMRGEIGLVQERDVERFTQLLNKSNQFNLRTRRYDEAEMEKKIQNQDSACLYAKLWDKFSEYGIISCVVLQKQDEKCFIESWVMSCRVLKRGVEQMMFTGILRMAKKWECRELIAEYLPTKKNAMVKEFCESLGFRVTAKRGESKKYQLELTQGEEKDKHKYIEVKYLLD